MMRQPTIERPVPTASGPPPPLADDPSTQVDKLYADLVERRAALSLPPPPPSPEEGASRCARSTILPVSLVGSGEGIYGVVDHYPADVPGAPWTRLASIERRCAEWRWRLREHEGRLCRTHGDFHPFNILFDGDKLVLLDAS